MAQPNKQAKSMSSRLMNMKFMQRSSASPSQTPSTRSLEPPAKRQRLSNGTVHSTPSTTPRSRAEGSEGEALTGTASPVGGTPITSHLDETEWYLSVKKQEPTAQQTPLRIVSAGYSALDAADSAVPVKDEDDQVPSTRMHGRRSFGKFNRRLEVR
ncbi:hypothetical protein BDY17DRAFT_147921 [Neohortaea acidophila]|uniref:Uncharacterized protein n=1 Tax=Neohortaea acidophila TaxID=245834 RepID=A0A6A6PTM0_9PEZI|nr:uncharacterized protein BDY17DRAFT_147921 [Neohortaea acidophila]KAF2483459.1 hypothetical protein BDY17DRAFT_147921 [Neohortaea acidophila]